MDAARIVAAAVIAWTIGSGLARAEQVEPASAPTPAVSDSPAASDSPTSETSDSPSSAAIADALTVDPGATCLEHDRLSEQVVGWLGRDEIDPRLHVAVEGDANDTRSLRFTLGLQDEVLAERVFSPGPSRCDDLHAVVALAIALAIDATVLETVGVEPEPKPTPKPEPKPKPEPEFSAVPPEPLDLDPPPRRWQLRAHLLGQLTYGVPPDVGGGGSVGLELGFRELVDVQVGAIATSAGGEPIDGANLAVTMIGARVDGCVGPRIDRIRPRGCLGLIAGSAVARGRGFFEADYRATVPWAAATLGADVRVDLTRRLRLAFGVDGLVNVIRPVFDVREDLEVRKLRELPYLGAMFGVGLVIVLR